MHVHMLTLYVVRYNNMSFAPILILGLWGAAMALLLGFVGQGFVQHVDLAVAYELLDMVSAEEHAMLQQYVSIPLASIGRLLQIVTVIQAGATG